MMQMQQQRLQIRHLRGEVPLDELLSDPVMPVLWRADRISERDVRRLMAETRERLRHPQNVDGSD
jgi:hypothetical protein